MDVLGAHQSQAPMPPSERCSVNPELERIVMRCLGKDAAHRYQNGLALCRAIEDIQGFSALEARRRSSHSHAPLPSPGIDLETADTIRPVAATTQKTLVDLGVGPALAPTLDLTVSQAKLEFHNTLVALAKAVIESGYPDTQLVMAFGTLHQARQTLEQHTEKLDALFHEGEAMEQRFREQQTAMRFELNDLSFHASEDTATMDRELAQSRANDITEDLVRAEYKFERAMQNMVDTEVNQAAMRDNVEQSLEEQYAHLQERVDVALGDLSLTPTLHARLAEFHEAKQTYFGLR